MGHPEDDLSALPACAELRRLVEAHRTSCFGDLRPTFAPRTREECALAIARLRRHGDLEVFRRLAPIARTLGLASA